MSRLREYLCSIFCRRPTTKEDLESMSAVSPRVREAFHRMNNSVSALQGSTRETHKEIDELTDAFKQLTDEMGQDHRRRQ